MTIPVGVEEIVAFRLGSAKGTITNNRETIVRALQAAVPYEELSRRRMQFMANLDLGARWEQLATAPALFWRKNGVYFKPCLDAKGQLQPLGT